MNDGHHHRPSDTDTAPPTRRYIEDREQFHAALEDLHRVADAAEETPNLNRLVADAVRDAEQRARIVASRSLRVGVLSAVVVALCAAIVVGILAYAQARNAAQTAAQLVAGNAASSEVESARSSSLLVMRRDFAAANQALAAAGLTPVPDPGPAASAFQMAAATGEALGTLRAVGELQARGAVQVPGVTVPAPNSPRFPDLRYLPPSGPGTR